MIKNFLSRYSPKYPRSLVYMLQASQYGLRDYLRWYHQTKDFQQVEQRKQLVKTPKALLLLGMSWVIVLGIYSLAFFALWISAGPLKYVLFLSLALSAPWILAYVLLGLTLLVKVIFQLPLEYIITRQAQAKLKHHQAVKIAIAGSFGKTSMREILQTVLSKGKRTKSPPYSYNTPLGISHFIKGLKGNEEVLVFELGEHYPGDVRRLCQLIQPQIGIITGVNEAHLQRFKTLQQTANTIFELAEYLDKKYIYINQENKTARERAQGNYILYSRKGVREWRVEHPHTDLEGTSFVLVKKEVKLEVKSRLLGLHQIGPLAVAADIGSSLGLSPDEIRKGINKTKPFSHRLEPSVKADGVIILDDSYNGNPDGVKAGINFLASLKNHRRFYVTPGLVEMGSRAQAVHQEIGARLAKAGIEKVVLIKNSVSVYIAQALKRLHYQGEILWFDSALDFFSALPHLTVKGDVVLLQNDWPDQYQ